MTAQSRDAAVKPYLTTPDRRNLLTALPEIAFPAVASGAGAKVIQVEAEKTKQTIDGFGAALTDSSAYLLMRAMPEKTRETLLHSLFDAKEGNGFAVLRVPLGASDFAVGGSYTYHDLAPGETDPSLRRFSVERDRQYLLPLLRRIRQINPDLKIIASPWSAPAWMKTGKSLNGGWLDWPAYPVYAEYLTRCVESFAAEGAPIYALTVQNEPRHESNSYPSMRMEPRDQARFVRDHLGPALEKAGLKTKILVWDHNWDAPEFPMEVLSDAAARRFIAGTAWHGYGGEPSAQAKVRDAYPDKEIYFTESSGGEFAPDFGGNTRWDMSNVIIGAMRYGARCALKWNLVLDENHGPQNGGCKDCRGVVTLNRKTGEVTRNEEYYALGHASRFVRPGSVALETVSPAELPALAFRNPDGSFALLVCNNGGGATSFTLRVRDRAAEIPLPAGALITLTWA